VLCLLCPRKRTCAVQLRMSAKGQKRTSPSYSMDSPEMLKLSYYSSITVFAGISCGEAGVLPKVNRRCSHVSSCAGVFGMVT
jgi:hypothetical protein